MRAKRVAIALIILAIVVAGGAYLYNEAYGPICLPSGHLAMTGAELVSTSSSFGSGTYEFSLCNGTGRTINWMGASINSQMFLSTGPEWVHAANGTYLDLEGPNSGWLGLPQLLPSQQVCNFTFAGWAYDAGMVGTTGMVLNAGSDNSTSTTGVVNVALNDTQAYFQLSSLDFLFPNSGVGVRNTGYVPGSFKDKWTFLALVLDNGQTRGYVNGTEAWLGRNVGCTTLKGYSFGGDGFNGVVRSVSSYDRALSSAEINELYSGQSLSSGLSGYWRVNDGHGCTVQDSSGNSKNGAISGCISITPGSTYLSNPVSSQNQPAALPTTVSNLSPGERVTFSIAVEFSDGSTSQVSTQVVVR
jgi:hypothetical protein